MAKNFEDICCVLCGGKNNIKDAICMICGKAINIYNGFIGQTIDSLYLKSYVARGFYGLTYRAKDNFGKNFAVKLISKEAYANYDKDFYDEAEKFAAIPDSPTIVKYISAGEVQLKFEEIKVPFYYIVSEWIPGKTLSDYLNTENFDGEDLVVAARDLLSGLQELYDLNIWHNDLHDENVIISTLTKSQKRYFGRTIERIYKIIDVGSMVYRNPSDTKLNNDIVNVGSHLFSISKKLCQYIERFSKANQVFLLNVEVVLTQMMDENPSRNFKTPVEALEQIERVYNSSRLGLPKKTKELKDPYGYINANDIPSSWLLKHMFSDRLSYFKSIMNLDQQSLLITGPRGCGKTMILRVMSFKTFYNSQDQIDKEKIQELPYVGIFFSARTHFGNYLVSLREQAWADDEKQVMYYFNLLITKEIVDVLYCLHNEKLASDDSVKIVLDFVSDRFFIPYLTINTIHGKLIDLSRSVLSDRPDKISLENSTPAFLNDLINLFKNSTDLIRDKDVILLIDDLSLPRVPEKIQKAIIPAIFNTGAIYKTRVTSHSEGLITQDFAGEVYNSNRDYVQMNLGFEYWELSNNYEICRDSFNDIFSKRFELSNKSAFPGIENLLGVGDELEDVGRKICKLKNEGKLRTLKYKGARAFIRLCTGDLSYSLDILGKMELRNIRKKMPIGTNIQNDVIRNYARTELLSLQDIKAEHVPSLYDIAYYFGVLSKAKLVKLNKDYLKIEVEVQELSDELRTTLRELLCYGIFIDAGYGNNSDGKLAKKLFFRRIYTPAFPTTFITRNTLPMRKKTFYDFVYNPKNFTRKRMSKDKIPRKEQQNLEQLEEI